MINGSINECIITKMSGNSGAIANRTRNRNDRRGIISSKVQGTSKGPTTSKGTTRLAKAADAQQSQVAALRTNKRSTKSMTKATEMANKSPKKVNAIDPVVRLQKLVITDDGPSSPDESEDNTDPTKGHDEPNKGDDQFVEELDQLKKSLRQFAFQLRNLDNILQSGNLDLIPPIIATQIMRTFSAIKEWQEEPSNTDSLSRVDEMKLTELVAVLEILTLAKGNSATEALLAVRDSIPERLLGIELRITEISESSHESYGATSPKKGGKASYARTKLSPVGTPPVAKPLDGTGDKPIVLSGMSSRSVAGSTTSTAAYSKVPSNFWMETVPLPEEFKKPFFYSFTQRIAQNWTKFRGDGTQSLQATWTFFVNNVHKYDIPEWDKLTCLQFLMEGSPRSLLDQFVQSQVPEAYLQAVGRLFARYDDPHREKSILNRVLEERRPSTWRDVHQLQYAEEMSAVYLRYKTLGVPNSESAKKILDKMACNLQPALYFRVNQIYGLPRADNVEPEDAPEVLELLLSHLIEMLSTELKNAGMSFEDTQFEAFSTTRNFAAIANTGGQPSTSNRGGKTRGRGGGSRGGGNSQSKGQSNGQKLGGTTPTINPSQGKWVQQSHDKPQNKGQKRSSDSALPPAKAQATGQPRSSQGPPVCIFCGEAHRNTNCPLNIHARREALREAKRCWNCKEEGHVSKECKYVSQCTRCPNSNFKHCNPVCMKSLFKQLDPAFKKADENKTNEVSGQNQTAISFVKSSEEQQQTEPTSDDTGNPE